MSMTAKTPSSPWRERFSHWLGDSGTAMLRCLPAEAAHDVGMWLLAHGFMERLPKPTLEPLTAGMRVSVPGIGELDHPLGLAAGFDKNCRAPHGFVGMGFSFLEIGTVTPRAQAGNPKPRLFRQEEQKALVNRMGFNSDGALAVAERLRRLDWQHDLVPLGINCGKNKDTPADRAINDYLQVIETFRGLARYFVINISSPNTPGLRDLATPSFIQYLADEIGGDLSKIWVKIDPDMNRREFQALVEAAVSRGFQGLVLSNTHRVVWPEPGGQSGHPLMSPATTCLEWAHEVHEGKMPMIATGGVLSGADVFHKMARGASVVQLYTALVYRGPWTVAKVLTELAAELSLRGYGAASDAIGSFYGD